MSVLLCGFGCSSTPSLREPVEEPDDATDSGPAAKDAPVSPGDTGGPRDTSVSDTGASPPVDTGAAPVDSGIACDRPSGGDPCDPGQVQCNGAPCNVSTHFCCADDTKSSSCVASGSTCGANALHCDEKADCPAGQVCCLIAKSFSNADARCQTSCSGGLFAIQLCKTNAECLGGAKCVVQTCSGAKMEACGSIPC